MAKFASSEATQPKVRVLTAEVFTGGGDLNFIKGYVHPTPDKYLLVFILISMSFVFLLKTNKMILLKLN